MANGEDKNLADPKNHPDLEEQDITTQNNTEDFTPLPTTDVDLFSGEVAGAQLPRPTEHEGVDVKEFLDYTGSDLNLLTDDAEAIRARNQPGWEQLGAFVNQALLGELVGGSLEGAGYLIDFDGMIGLARGTEQEFGSWLSEIGRGIKEWSQEATPIYAENPGEFDPGDSGWWFKNGVSVFSTLSLMIPSGAALKGLGLAGRSLSKGAGMIRKGADLAKKFDNASGLTQDTIRGISQAFLSRHAENLMEAAPMFEEKYKELLAKGLSEEDARARAAEGARAAYAMNSAMLLQDFAQYALLHRYTGGKGPKSVSPTKAAQAVEKQVSNLPGGRYMSLAADFASEGAEEAYQYIVEQEAGYISDVGAGVRDPSDFSDRLGEYMNDGELWTSAFFGGIGSLVMQTAGPKIMEKMSQKTGGFKGDPLEFAKNYTAKMSLEDQAIRAAREQGLDEQADYMEDHKVASMTIHNFEHDSGESHIDQLRAMEEMSAEEAEQYAQELSDKYDIEVDPKSIMDKAKRHREIAEETGKIYRDLRDKYGKEVAGSATEKRMNGILNKRKATEKRQQISDYKTNIPEYEDLSSNGQTIFDLEMELEGLKRAEKSTKRQIRELESDEELSTLHQSALENIQANRKEVEKNLEREKEKEYDSADRKRDNQKREGLDPYIDEAAKLISEREIAEQQSNINRKQYNAKIKIAKDKSKQEDRKERAETDKEFKKKTVPAEDDSSPIQKGDPVTVNGKPGEYVGSFEKGGKTFHKIKDIGDPTGSTWEIKDEDLNKKVKKRKYRQDVADEAKEKSDVKQSRKEQDNVKKAEQQEKKDQRPTPDAENIDRRDPPEGMRPDLPSLEELTKQKQTSDAMESAQEEIGGAENIEVPPNDESGDPHTPSSPSKIIEEVDGHSLSVASINNPKSYIRQDLAAAEEEGQGEQFRNSERWKDAEALTEFIENPSVTIKDSEGNYNYYVEAEIDFDNLDRFAGTRVGEKVRNKEEGLSDDELGRIPIKTKFFNADGTPVTTNGREVYTYLHTLSFFTTKTVPKEILQDIRNNLINTRAAIYGAYRHSTSMKATVVKQTEGHFLPKENVTLGDFSTYNNVADVFQEENYEDIKLAVLNKGGFYTGSDGNILPELSLAAENAPERAGAVYAATVAANGRPKPMRLFVDTFTNEEADIVYALYKSLITSDHTPTSVIPDEIKNLIRNSNDSRITDIENILGSLNDVSHLDLLNFLVYEGKKATSNKKESALWAELEGKNSTLNFGTEGTFTVEDFDGDKLKHEFVDWLQNNRRRQIERRFLNTPEYNEYLIKNDIVKTTVAVQDDARHLIGPNTITGEFTPVTKKDEIDHIAPPEERRDEDEGDEEGPTINDVFQKRRISNADSLPDALGQRGMIRLLDRLQDKFNVPYQIIDNPDVEWAGKTDMGTVFINTAHATLDTPFHEFAHPLIYSIKRNNVRLYMGLVEQMRESHQGRKIIERVRRAYPDHTAEQRLDEALVQSLGEMAAGNVFEDSTGFRRMLRNLWISLKRMMRRIFGVDVKVDPSEISPNTTMRELSEMLSDDLTTIDLSGNLLTAEQKPEWMTQPQYRDWIDSLTYMLLKSNTSQDISELEGLEISTVRDIVYNTMQKMDKDDPLYEEYQRVLDDMTISKMKGIKGPGRLNPESKLLLAVQRKLRSFGVTPDQEVEPEERDSRLNIRASYEFSNKDKASANVKLMVAMIPKLNSAKLVDNKFGTQKPDYKISPHTGMPQFHNFADTWNVLQTTLSDTVETISEGRVEDLYDVFVEKLKGASNLRPEMKFLMQHLENVPEYKRTQFVQVLALASQNFTSTTFRRTKDGFRFKIGTGDTQSISAQIVDEWASNFKSKISKIMYTKETREPRMAFDQEKSENLIQRFRDLRKEVFEQSKESNDVPLRLKEKLQSLLEDTGINISIRAIDKLIQDSEAGGTEINRFNQMFRGSQQTSIRFIYEKSGDRGSTPDLSLENLLGKAIVIPEGNVNLAITEEAFVRKMAEAEGYFRNNLADSTVLGPDNKPFWMFSQYNSMYKKIAEWKKNPTSLATILAAPYNGNSVWGNWLLESKENREAFELQNLMNIRQEFSADRGSKNTELGITDLLSVKLNMMLEGIYSLPARADNTTDYFIKGPSAKQSFRVTEDNRLELRDSAVDTIKGYILDEVARVKHAELQVDPEKGIGEENWVKDYHYKLDENGNKDPSLGNAFKIHLMPSLNDPAHGLFNSRGKITTMTAEKLDLLDDLIRNSFMKQFKRDLKKMTNDRVIRKTKNGYVNNAIDTKKMEFYEGEASNSEDLGVQAAIMDYTFNGIIANQEWHKLFGGDIASYKDREDFQKRATGPGSTGLIYRIMEDMKHTYNSAVVSDIVTQSDLVSDENIKAIAEYTGNTQKDVRAMLEPYNRVDRADAQAWITPEQYRDRMRGYGKWTPKHEMAFHRLNTGQQLPSDLKMFMQPLKTVHTEMKIQDGANIFHYNKQSEAVLHPDVARSLGLGNLLRAMKKNGTDHVVVESGKKAGASGITTIADENGNILPTSEIQLNNVELSKRYLFLQQELPRKGMGPSKEGSQVRKNFLEGIDPSQTYTLPNGESMDGDKFLSEIHKTIGALSDKGLDEVLTEIKYNEETGEYDQNRLYNFLLASFTRREVEDNLVQALNDRIPLDAIPQMRIAIENQLASLINKKAIDLKHDTGGSFIQMSDVGFTTEIKGVDKELVTWVKQEARNGLKAPRIDPETGEFKPGQILIPHKILQQLPGINESNIKEIMKDISTGISYRIPNQSTSSNDIVEIVGILPEEMGDTVVAYKEVTTKFGSDFDIDKLQVMLPNYRISGDEVKVINFRDIDTNDESQLEEVYNEQYQNKKNFLSYLEGKLTEKQMRRAEGEANIIDFYDSINDEDILIDADRNITLRDYHRIKREVENMPTIDEFISEMKGASPYKVNSKEAVQNRKLELYRAMLSNPKTYMKMIKPLESDWLKNGIRERKEARTYERDFDAFSPTTQAEIRKTFVDTKAAVGQIANHSTDHSFSQSANLYLNDTKEDNKGNPYYIGIGNSVKIGGEKATYLSGETDVDGNNIMETLSAFMTANVDAAKDPYITDGNFNLFTNPVAMFLARSGVSRGDIIKFMDQPIIRALAEVTAEYDGRTSSRHKVPEKGEVTATEFVTWVFSKRALDKPITDLTDHKEFDPDALNARDVLDNLDPNNDATQLEALSLFLKWKGFASALTDNIQASKADVNGMGPSITAAHTKENLRKKVNEDRVIGNFENKFSGTFLENFHKNSVEISSKVFGPETFLSQSQGVQDLIEGITRKLGLYPLTSEDISFTLNAEIYAYLMSGTSLAVSPEQLEAMFRGKKTMARRLMNIKGGKNTPVRDNPLIQYLGYHLGDTKADLDYIYGQGSKQLTVESKNELTEAWKELWMHDDADVREFAEDLARYAYYSSGFRRNLASFHELIPVSLTESLGITKDIEDLQEELNTDSNPIASAEEQIIKNLSQDGRIVPYLSSKSPKLKVGKFPTKKVFGLSPGDNQHLVIGTDKRGNPVMKPYINVDGNLYEYRGLGEIETKTKDEEGNIKKRIVGIYTPTNDLGIKEGRFRVKEYYKNLSGMDSIFERNNVEIDPKVTDLLNTMGVRRNYVSEQTTREASIQEDYSEGVGPSEAEQRLREIEQLSEEEISKHLEIYRKLQDDVTLDEYIQGVKDNLNC